MSEFMDFDVLSGNEFLAKELKAYSSNPDLLFFTSFGLDDMRARSQPVAGFIVPYKCYELRKLEKCKYGNTFLQSSAPFGKNCL